ncbi:MAG TPA: YdeI/OmpD-associated family protein [Candidatus Paceibacterota bacterium]
MPIKRISGGTAHTLPGDLRKALSSSVKALSVWEDITPLARNEWICWTISVKTLETRKHHVVRAVEELADGKRRPCCWIGCVHRTDKPINATQKFILGKKSTKK